MPRNTSTYTVARKRTGLQAGPGSSRITATTSAQTSTMTSAIRNTWTLIQKPFSNDLQAASSVRVAHPKKTLRTA